MANEVQNGDIPETPERMIIISLSQRWSSFIYQARLKGIASKLLGSSEVVDYSDELIVCSAGSL